MKNAATKKTGARYVINGKPFTCVFDAMEYREVLDAHYVKVVWKTLW